MPETIIQIPNPGDHYSPATGSATISIIYEISRAHVAAGGDAKVVVSKGTAIGYPPYPVGELVEVGMAMALPGKRQKVLDVLAGTALHRRPFMSAAYSGAIEYVAKNPDGVVIVHNEPGMLTALRRAAPSARICFWAHNDLFRTYGGPETRAVVRACDRVVCVSDYIAGGIRRKIGTDGGLYKKIHVVLNGVDVERFKPAGREPVGPPLILFVGRVVEQKGPDLLLKAALMLKRRGLDFRVRIVGSGGFSAAGGLTPYEEALRGIARELGDRLEFRPFVPREQVPSQLQEAAIFCVPSSWDAPCPLTVLEGLACGLPMVVARRGGIPEECGDAALYFAPPDVEALAEQLERLIRNPEERRRLGAAARARAEQSAWAVRYEQLMAALNEQ